MSRVIVFGLAAITLLSNCRTQAPQPPSTELLSVPPELESASASYKKNRDYASLEKIYRHLKLQMKREYVELLLGKPVYSPGEGLDYYPSDRRESLADEGAPPQRTAPIGLVLDYRDMQNILTNRLQKMSMARIAE